MITRTLLSLVPIFLISCAGIPEQRPSALSYAYDQPSPASPKKICIFMDGTANDHDSQTHVRHLYELISSQNSFKILSYYDTGVGAETNRIGGTIGGRGFTKNLKQAYAFLAANFHPDDEIFIFGYSRGARQAHILADMVTRMGLPALPRPLTPKETENNLKSVAPLMARYKKEWKLRNSIETNPNTVTPPQFPQLAHKNISVEGLYIWDNVETMGNNIATGFFRMLKNRLKPVSYSRHATYTYLVPHNLKECYHAMAMDEKRGLYEVIPLIKPSTYTGIVENVWFAGTHGDIGGSYDASEALAGNSLNWILSKIRDKGLLPNPEHRVEANPLGVSVDSSKFVAAGKILNKLRHPRVRRQQFWGDFWAHYSHDNNAKENQASKPMIHWSVLQRLQADGVLVQPGEKFLSQINPEPYRPWVLFEPKYDRITYPASNMYPEPEKHPDIKLPGTTKPKDIQLTDIVNFIDDHLEVVPSDEGT